MPATPARPHHVRGETLTRRHAKISHRAPASTGSPARRIRRRNRFEGVWTTPKADNECASAEEGSKHWGKVWFKLSDFGRTMTGKWGYCDKEPDQDFKAEWKKP